MARIQPDFSEAVQFGEVVPGLYKLQVVGSAMEVAQNERKTRMINWSFTIAEVIKGGDVSEVGRNLWRRTPIEGKGAGFLEEFLKAVRPDLVADKGKPWDTEELHGEFVGAAVGNRAYTDQASGEKRVAPDITRFFSLKMAAEDRETETIRSEDVGQVPF
jgi:hypothetical protein